MCDLASDLDICSVWRERTPRARKPHVCATCGRTIPVGTQHVSLFTVCDGDAISERSCVECWADHEVFGDAPGHTMTQPSQFLEMLRECVVDAGDEWAAMLARIEARRGEVTP